MKMPNINNILVVDDDEISVFLSTSIIKSVKKLNKITSANNGEEAIGLIFNRKVAFPLLILLDLNMPIMDGFEFLEEFEHLGMDEEIFIAVVSSSTNEKDIDKAKGYNIIDYVEKPLTKMKFQEVINKVA